MSFIQLKKDSSHWIFAFFGYHVIVIFAIESTKTTSMEDVSTGVLEKRIRSKDKAKKWYDVSRHISLHMSKYKKKNDNPTGVIWANRHEIKSYASLDDGFEIFKKPYYQLLYSTDKHFLRVRWLDLTHWGRVTHICVGNLTIIGPDNGLSPGRRQAIIWTKAGILLIGLLGTSFSENLIEILKFSFTKLRLKMSSAKWRPFCVGLNVLKKNHPGL